MAEQEGNGQEKEVSRDGMVGGNVGSRYLQELVLSEEVEKKRKQSHFAGRNCSTGEISSDLYGLSWCDILNLTFCRLDFHQLLIKIS